MKKRIQEESFHWVCWLVVAGMVSLTVIAWSSVTDGMRWTIIGADIGFIVASLFAAILTSDLPSEEDVNRMMKRLEHTSSTWASHVASAEAMLHEAREFRDDLRRHAYVTGADGVKKEP